METHTLYRQGMLSCCACRSPLKHTAQSVLLSSWMCVACMYPTYSKGLDAFKEEQDAANAHTGYAVWPSQCPNDVRGMTVRLACYKQATRILQLLKIPCTQPQFDNWDGWCRTVVINVPSPDHTIDTDRNSHIVDTSGHTHRFDNRKVQTKFD